jgi:hypothetical protein
MKYIMKPKKKQFFFIFQLGIKKATKARILKLLMTRSPRIDSKEPIPAGCVACRATTKTPFLLGSHPS